MTPEELKALREDVQADPNNDINTKTDFARALGYKTANSRRTVTRWENGEQPIQGPALIILEEWQERRKRKAVIVRQPYPRANLS